MGVQESVGRFNQIMKDRKAKDKQKAETRAREETERVQRFEAAERAEKARQAAEKARQAIAEKERKAAEKERQAEEEKARQAEEEKARQAEQKRREERARGRPAGWVSYEITENPPTLPYSKTMTWTQADDLFKREGLPKAPLDLPADVYHEAVESWMNENRPKNRPKGAVTRGQRTTLPINKNGHVQITAIKKHVAAANKRMGWVDAMLKKAKADGITDTEFSQLRTVAFADKELWQRVNGQLLTVHQPQSGEGTKTRKVSLAQGTSALYTTSNRQYRVPYPRFDSFPYDVFPSLDWYDVDG
eukprot:jgi/Mesvir1/10455/Mv12086-RA.1